MGDETYIDTDYTWLKLEIFKALLGTTGGDYVTEHLIRDSNKVFKELFTK